MTTIVRAQIAHTPRNPFVEDGALQAFSDGALAFVNGRILSTGLYNDVRAGHLEAEVLDARDAFLLPGFVDCHVDFPQIRAIGAMGLELMEWLRTRCLPEEALLADSSYAASVAERFVSRLAANGTTMALVFGSHFAEAQSALFAAASSVGLRIASGLVVSDQGLLPSLHTTVREGFEASRALIERWHGRGLMRYAVSPRFSVSCSDEMLAVCGELSRSADGLLVTSHMNESPGEISEVARLFGWSRDYVETYERFGLVGDRSVFAHDVHVSDDELRRLAARGASVAHCPSSNAFLGSGLFRLRRHLSAGVRRGPGRVSAPAPGSVCSRKG